MMPGYSNAAGGTLTDEQINILVDGILKSSKGQTTAESGRPPYAAPPGDAQRGAAVYAQDCAQCHGNEGTGGKAVVDELQHAALNARCIKCKEAQRAKAKMANAGIGNEPLDVGLGESDQSTIDDSCHAEPKERRYEN